jgi:hypothetical protein
MPSPFPGMDPFLEHPPHSTDFHSRFINVWCESLADALPEEFEASLGERVYLVEQDPETRKLIYPDMYVLERAGPAKGHAAAARGAAVLEPVTIPLVIPEGPREAFIEILYKPEQALVAVLELLSPPNKEGPGRTEYLLKRNALLHQDVHLVELDLLLGGHRLPMRCALPPGDYYYFVSRAEQRPDCLVYAWPLSQPLPQLPVPLRPPFPDIAFELAAVFSTAYDRGRFARRIEYTQKCPAPLSANDRQWVGQIVSTRGVPGVPHSRI